MLQMIANHNRVLGSKKKTVWEKIGWCHKIAILMWSFSYYEKMALYFTCLLHMTCNLGVVHKWRHCLRGRGQGFCGNNPKAFLIKSVTKRVGSKIVQNYMTLFMNDPFAWFINKFSLAFTCHLNTISVIWYLIKHNLLDH